MFILTLVSRRLNVKKQGPGSCRRSDNL
jgi:hypothetical protein